MKPLTTVIYCNFNNVTSIGMAAFVNCKSLGSVTIPDSVNSIGMAAFVNCKSLGSVTIPDSVTSIGHGAFFSSSLASVIIGKGVTSIGNNAFGSCTSLISVTFQGMIASDGFATTTPFLGDLQNKYLAGGIGTYTTTAPVGSSSVWTKQ